MQKHEVINKLMRQYSTRTPITRQGLNILYDRAHYRGYDAKLIYIGLKTVIAKNYLRKEYVPPCGDITLEVIDERRYIEDWEFRRIMQGCQQCNTYGYL